MTGPAPNRPPLLVALLAERFPTAGEVRREVEHRPPPLDDPAAGGTGGPDDEVSIARRRQILNRALTSSYVPRGVYAA